MHQRARILLCRMGFVLLCVLPTTVVAGWIVSRGAGGYSAAQKAEWQRELTSRLGLAVEIGEVSYPSPRVAHLRAVKLLAPETRKAVAEAALIEVAQAAEGWTVDAVGLSIEANELAALSRSLEERLLRGQTPLRVRWLRRDVLLRGGEQGQTLAQTHGSLQSTADQSSLEVYFNLPGQTAGSEPIHLHATRNRKQREPTTEWRLDTGGTALPCSLAAAAAPALAGLGKGCEFRGKLRVVQSPQNASGELAGTLERVDLDTLVTEQFPHQLSGEATVTIDNANFQRSKLVEVRGVLQAQDGALSASLLAAAQEHLGLEAGLEFADSPPAAAIPFQNLAIGFHLSGQSLSLTEGVLIANSNGPVLIAPPDHASTGANLLRTLLPDSQYQVPATRQTDTLVRLMPLPDVAPGSKSPPAHTPTRLAPAERQTQSPVRQPVLR
jgi:hypothetical protein